MRRKINYTGEQVDFHPAFDFGQKRIDRERLAGLPPIGREDKDVRRIIQECDGPKLGLDFEFEPKSKKAHITGVATKKGAAAAKFSLDTLKLIAEKAERGVQLVGHSVLGADRPTMELELGYKTPLRWWTDTMLKHYLVSQDLCKVEKGGKEEDEAGGGLGFMNLGTMAMMYTRLWNWKQCEGYKCNGLICPVHDPLGYCAVDSYAGLACDDELDKRTSYWQIPEQFISEVHELGEICLNMEYRGVKVSRERIRELDLDIETAKEKLFKKNDEGEYIEFNPRSGVQGLKWFARRKINLKSFSKGDIQIELEKRAAKAGYIGEKLKDVILEMENDPDLAPDLDTLLRLYQYKNAGKGTKSWFDDKYIDSCNVIHPRFIVSGTSTGRLASSKPNFQNIAARGWGELIKSCVIPHNPDNLIVDSDLSQLELRICLYLSGVDPSVIGKDAFKWLVQQGQGLFEQAAQNLSWSARDLAKITSHAADYMEGITLLSKADLMKPTTKKLIEFGALRVYLKKYGAPFDWEYCGKIVAFNGGNLAERLFKNREHESRKKALQIQEDVYFASFPSIRRWQKEILDFIQENGYTRSRTGRILRLYGMPMDNAKVGVAFHGQGTGADYIQGNMIAMHRADGRLPLMQVHDSLVDEVPKSWSHEKIREYIEPMYQENWRLPGFSCPGKIKIGPNYGQLVEI